MQVKLTLKPVVYIALSAICIVLLSYDISHAFQCHDSLGMGDGEAEGAGYSADPNDVEYRAKSDAESDAEALARTEAELDLKTCEQANPNPPPGMVCVKDGKPTETKLNTSEFKDPPGIQRILPGRDKQLRWNLALEFFDCDRHEEEEARNMCYKLASQHYRNLLNTTTYYGYADGESILDITQKCKLVQAGSI